ncbi:hypothetical protein Hanom_Chr06g00482351 [Helianthus anomalus]
MVDFRTDLAIGKQTIILPSSLKGFLMVFFSFCHISFSPQSASATIFKVMAYGPKRDGNTDDIVVNHVHFCRLSFDHGLVFVTTARATPMMVMPPRKLFQIGPVTFSGPCKSPAVNVQENQWSVQISYRDKIELHFYGVGFRFKLR